MLPYRPLGSNSMTATEKVRIAEALKGAVSDQELRMWTVEQIAALGITGSAANVVSAATAIFDYVRGNPNSEKVN